MKSHPNGGFVLFTVNLDNAVLKGSFRFRQPLKRVSSLHENRGTLVMDGDSRRFVDDYEPFETHIYRVEME